MTEYHHAAYTLDPDKEFPPVEKTPPAVGHSEEQAQSVRERHEARREIADAEREAYTERQQEWAERDPKPTPSELLRERGSEPPEDSQAEPPPGSEEQSTFEPSERTTQEEFGSEASQASPKA